MSYETARRRVKRLESARGGGACALCESRAAYSAAHANPDLVVVDSYKQPTNCPRCGRGFTILVQFVERRNQYEAAR
jgi:hypothetical protein